jgi:hypothetical protein
MAVAALIRDNNNEIKWEVHWKTMENARKLSYGFRSIWKKAIPTLLHKGIKFDKVPKIQSYLSSEYIYSHQLLINWSFNQLCGKPLYHWSISFKISQNAFTIKKTLQDWLNMQQAAKN